MRQQLEVGGRAQSLECDIVKLEAVNKKLAKLLVEKEQLTASIIASIGHEHEGERTYEFNAWNVKVKTPYIYSVDTKAYRSGEVFIEDGFNPIEESISYKVNRAKAEEYFQRAPSSVREALTKLITKKPGKPGIVIGMRKL